MYLFSGFYDCLLPNKYLYLQQSFDCFQCLIGSFHTCWFFFNEHLYNVHIGHLFSGNASSNFALNSMTFLIYRNRTRGTFPKGITHFFSRQVAAREWKAAREWTPITTQNHFLLASDIQFIYMYVHKYVHTCMYK